MSDAPRQPGATPGVLATDPERQSEITFGASIERVIFKNDENGYAVLRVLPDGRDAGRSGVPLSSLTCVGTLLHPEAGMRLMFRGRFVRNPKFGRQFQFSSANEQMPTSEAALISYLSSKLIKGMGPDIAERVVRTFGQDTMRVLDEEPERLQQIRGIGKKNWQTIVDSWREHRALSDLMQFLQPQGISPAYGVRIYKEYGVRAVQIVKENPYRLAMDIRGIGFLTADRIARQLNFPLDSPLRMQGAVLYELQKAAESGNVFLPYRELVDRIVQELSLRGEAIPPAIETLEGEGRIVVESEPLTAEESDTAAGDRPVYLSLYHRCEDKTAYYLERLRQMPGNVTFKNVDKAVQAVLEQQSPKLSEEQAQAVRMAATSKVMVLTGGPGTGKTTIIKAIISLFETVTSRISLAAPTGRAAKRMAEATGMEAGTLHRLLEYNPGTNTFERNEDEPLGCDLLIVDEASMMDLLIFHALMKALPTGSVVLFVGDVFQLPSVGPGAVLADIIASGKIPVMELIRIFRQGEGSSIVESARQVKNGTVPKLVPPWQGEGDFFFEEAEDMQQAAERIIDLVSHEIPARFGLDPLEDVQLITPMHRGEVGTINMNGLLQKSLNKAWKPSAQVPGAQPVRTMPEVRRGDVVFRCGDKVMQVRNNYEKDVFNGDVGTIVEIDPDRKLVSVVFDGRKVEYELSDTEELVLAYAISIHKSQGSEYPAVVIPLFMNHWIMLQRNLVYTAITRGKKLVVLVGEHRALKRAVDNTVVKRRYTRLATRLRNFI